MPTDEEPSADEQAPPVYGRWVFRDGKLLCFRYASEALPERVRVLRGWPECAAWERRPPQPWRGVRLRSRILSEVAETAGPDFAGLHVARWRRKEISSLEAPPTEERLARLARAEARLLAGWTARSEAARSFREMFPPSVFELACSVPRQWHLVQLMARCPGAEELASTNIALAAALASSWAFKERPVQQPLRSARSLLGKRRRVIAGWLGFPETEAAVRVLSKVTAEATSVERLLWLRRTLVQPSPPKALWHLPRLGPAALRILCTPELCAAVEPSLLEELGTAKDGTTLLRLLFDTVRMHTQLGQRGRLGLRSRAQVLERHGQLTMELNARGLQVAAPGSGGPPIELPPPPVPGSEAIVPLSTPESIAGEGRQMHHCVASYIWDVARGSVYIYQVRAPSRATLSLRRTARGWRMDELSGLCNAAVEPETRASVVEYLASVGVDVSPKRWRMQGCVIDPIALVGGGEIPF